jgi:hypothetical protein
LIFASIEAVIEQYDFFHVDLIPEDENTTRFDRLYNDLFARVGVVVNKMITATGFTFNWPIAECSQPSFHWHG